MQNVELKDALRRVRPGGCVRPYLEGFAAELFSTGYAVLSTVEYVRSAAHLGRWMDSRAIGVDQLSEATLAGFAQHPCQCPNATRHRQRPSRHYVARVRKFAASLGRLGVIPPLAGQPPRAVPPPLLGFRTWMIRVLLDEIRPLSCVYAKMFVTTLRAFLRFLAAEGRCRPRASKLWGYPISPG
jgi:hypothetical protein